MLQATQQEPAFEPGHGVSGSTTCRKVTGISRGSGACRTSGGSVIVRVCREAYLREAHSPGPILLVCRVSFGVGQFSQQATPTITMRNTVSRVAKPSSRTDSDAGAEMSDHFRWLPISGEPIPHVLGGMAFAAADARDRLPSLRVRHRLGWPQEQVTWIGIAPPGEARAAIPYSTVTTDCLV